MASYRRRRTPFEALLQIDPEYVDLEIDADPLYTLGQDVSTVLPPCGSQYAQAFTAAAVVARFTEVRLRTDRPNGIWISELRVSSACAISLRRQATAVSVANPQPLLDGMCLSADFPTYLTAPYLTLGVDFHWGDTAAGALPANLASMVANTNLISQFLGRPFWLPPDSVYLVISTTAVNNSIAGTLNLHLTAPEGSQLATL